VPNYIHAIDLLFNDLEPTMNALTSTSFKLSAMALSAALTLSLTGAVIQSFQHNAARTETTIARVQMPTVVIIGHRDAVVVPDTLQADAKLVVKSGA
jgi:hypothetical protein